MKKSPLPMQNICGTQKKQIYEKEALVKLLRWHFDHSQFRGKQLDAIQAVLSGQNLQVLLFDISFLLLDYIIMVVITLKYPSLCRERLLLFDANRRWKIDVLSNPGTG